MPKWILASDRLPKESGPIAWRWLDKEAAYTGYDEKGFIYDKGGAHCDPLYHIEIEWLDESEPSFSIQDMMDCWDECDEIHSQRSGCGVSSKHFENFMKAKYNIDITQ